MTKAVESLLFCCLFVFGEGSIEALQVPSRHPATDQLDLVVGDVKAVRRVVAYDAIDTQEQTVGQVVVLGSPGQPELQPLTDNDADQKAPDSGESVAVEHGNKSLHEWLCWLLFYIVVGFFVGFMWPPPPTPPRLRTT